MLIHLTATICLNTTTLSQAVLYFVGFNIQSRASLETQAADYIQHVTDCSRKMVGQLSARLEAVTYLDDSWGIPLILRPEDFINEVQPESLLENHAVILPFLDTKDVSLTNVLQEILEFISSELTNLFNSNQGKGGYFVSWKAFQLKIAFEELVYGHTLSPQSQVYSSPLDTCTIHPKSLTH